MIQIRNIGRVCNVVRLGKNNIRVRRQLCHNIINIGARLQPYFIDPCQRACAAAFILKFIRLSRGEKWGD